MSYKNSIDLLPKELIEQIQEYVDGKVIYIPKKQENKKQWGENTDTKRLLAIRNWQIHTDFEKGFIRAEITPYEDFVKYGSYAACKEKGVTRLEGKDYVVQDGDLVHFRFAV